MSLVMMVSGLCSVNPAALIIVQTVIKETHIPGYLSLKAVLLRYQTLDQICSQGSISRIFKEANPKKLDKRDNDNAICMGSHSLVPGDSSQDSKRNVQIL